jgi:hypothetical protein
MSGVIINPFEIAQIQQQVRRVQLVGLRVEGMGFLVWDLRVGVQGQGFGVWGLGFRVWGLEYGVWGLGFWV